MVPQEAFSDDAPGGVTNQVTGAHADASFQLNLPVKDDSDATSQFESLDGVDLGLAGSALQAGDLVEVSSLTNRLRILGVCLGNFNGHDHFYTSTGKWFTSRNFQPGFVIKGFIRDPSELRAIVDAIPSRSASDLVLDQLQDLNLGPTRDVAASLIHQLLKFQAASRSIHQTYVERFSNAAARLGPDEKLMSLREIADVLLPHSLKRGKKTFPPEELFAVYSSIITDNVGFRPLARGARHHESYLFTVHPSSTQNNIKEVEDLLRTFWEFLGNNSTKISRSSAAKAMQIRDFVLQARKAIDQSRASRVWSSHGSISPCQKKMDASSLEPVQWSETGIAVIQFVQHWAAVDAFQLMSQYHWVGASVLRAIGRYPEVALNRSTAWTFLQEIGWISPWDIPCRYSMRLPGKELDRHMGLNLPETEPKPAATPTKLQKDKLAHIRRDFARETVYCIDSDSTLDVDDGVSLELAPDGNHWVHIHVADPASRITPDSPMAEEAAKRVQSQYLAGFSQPMFKDEIVRETFSLGSNQPTLTFSALVTEDGKLVDYKITPGTIRDVVCITPQDVNSVCGVAPQHADRHTDVLEVGAPPVPPKEPVRRMVKPADLSRKQVADLRTLSKLADSLHQNRLAKGAVPYYLPRPTAEVSLANVEPLSAGDAVRCNGDPYIRISYNLNQSQLVASLMLLAGEVAARWCSERSIPLPYRVQLHNPENEAALEAFTRDVIYPQLAAGKRPSPSDMHTYRNLVGGFDLSATPGPNSSMGLDAYAKVTSPLRRYPDLIAHWQIESALLEEHRTGKSLTDKKGGPNNMPFSKEKFDNDILPILRIRERYAKSLDNYDGNTSWILQAVLRAWKFGENKESIPKTFKLAVSKVVPRQMVVGELDWFGIMARIEIDDLEGTGMRVADFEVGNVVEVEMTDIKLIDAIINVKPLKMIK